MSRAFPARKPNPATIALTADEVRYLSAVYHQYLERGAAELVKVQRDTPYAIHLGKLGLIERSPHRVKLTPAGRTWHVRVFRSRRDEACEPRPTTFTPSTCTLGGPRTEDEDPDPSAEADYDDMAALGSDFGTGNE